MFYRSARRHSFGTRCGSGPSRPSRVGLLRNGALSAGAGQSNIVIASKATQSRTGARDAELLRRHSPSKTGVNALMAPRNNDTLHQSDSSRSKAEARDAGAAANIKHLPGNERAFRVG